MVKFGWNNAELTTAQQKIAEYIERNLQAVLLMTEQEIADQLDLSIASVSRFWRAVDYRNLKDFKQQLALQIAPTPARKMESFLSQSDNSDNHLVQFQSAISHLQTTLAHFSDNKMDEAAKYVREADTVYIYGQGSSVSLQELLYFRLRRFGLNVHKITESGSELFEDIVHIKPTDVVIAFGFGSHALPEEQVLFSQAKERQFTVIAITDQLVSDISNQADLSLYGRRGEPWEFHSMVAPVLILETLVSAIGSYDKKESVSKLDALQELRKQYRDKLPRR